MQLLELSAHHFRAEGVDEHDFAKYYQEEHILRMIQIIQKHEITKYTPECLCRQEMSGLSPSCMRLPKPPSLVT